MSAVVALAAAIATMPADARAELIREIQMQTGGHGSAPMAKNDHVNECHAVAREESLGEIQEETARFLGEAQMTLDQLLDRIVGHAPMQAPGHPMPMQSTLRGRLVDMRQQARSVMIAANELASKF